MQEILFLSHRIPFPPDRGDKIRSHHVLKRLARIAPVHVATFADDDADMAEEVELATLAHSYKLVRRAMPLALAGLKALVASASRSALRRSTTRRSPPMSPKSWRAARSGRSTSFPARWASTCPPASPAGWSPISSTSIRPSSTPTPPGARAVNAWIYAREARLLRDEEARLAGRADTSLLISEAEADLFAARLTRGRTGPRGIRVLTNGIDSRHTSIRARSRPETADARVARSRG